MLAAAFALLLAAPGAWAATAPAEIEAAHVAAEALVRAGDYRGAAQRYREILADLATRPSTEALESEWARALLQLAVTEATVGNTAASRAAMERVLATDPAARLDPEYFSPSFRREFDAARARVAARPHFRLLVTTPDGAGQGFVQGRPIGPLPAEVSLPAGTYRVGVESSGFVRTVTVDLTKDDTVVLPAPPRPPDLRATAPAVPTAPATSPSGAWIRPTAWATTGLAVAAAGLATWQGIAAGNASSEAKGMLLPDGTLKPGVDPADYAAAAASFSSHRTNAWIAGGCAVLFGAGATVLWLLAPSAGVEPAPAGLAFRF